jgi:hypothetical protein
MIAQRESGVRPTGNVAEHLDRFDLRLEGFDVHHPKYVRQELPNRFLTMRIRRFREE